MLTDFNPTTDPVCLHTLCRAHAWSILAQVAGPFADEPIKVRVGSSRATVRIRIEHSRGPQPTDPVPARVGSWLSPTCSLILTKLGADTLARADLAKRCGMTFDMRFKTLVTDLVDRGILEDSDDGAGVRLARKGADHA